MKTIRKTILLLLCCAFVLSMAGVAALASGPIDTDKKCDFSVTFAPGEVPAADVSFELYRVADVSRGCSFQPTAAFAACSAMKLLEDPETEDYRILAMTLSGFVAEKKIASDAVDIADETGTAVFHDLPTGLYLVLGSVFHSGRSFFIPEPFLVCLPTLQADDTWLYNVETKVKYSETPDAAPVSFTVVKTWSDSSTHTHADDKVIVEIYDGKTLFTTVELSKQNNWESRFDDMYGGTVWSVVEKNSFDGYRSTVERSGDIFEVRNTKIGESSSPSGKLPQTGQLSWPVPLLAFLGLGLIAVGLGRRRSEDY